MDIQFHPDWKFNKGNYDADVAIVTLFGQVTVTETVQPICLPTQNDGVLIAPDGVVVSSQETIFVAQMFDFLFCSGRYKQHW